MPAVRASVPRVFKDSSGSHPSPDAHGHHAISPGEKEPVLARVAKPRPMLPPGRAAATRVHGQSPSQHSRSVGTEPRTDTHPGGRHSHAVFEARLLEDRSRPSIPSSEPLRVCSPPHAPAIGHPSSNNPTAPHEEQPYRLPLRFSSLSSVTTCLAPVQPRGWPRAIAPPRGFTFSAGIPSFSTQ